MLKTIRDMLVGAIVCFGAIAATQSFANLVGSVPPDGPALIDGAYVKGLAQGNNFAAQSGITAAGTTAATATTLNPNIFMYEVDTTASSTGVVLPFAIQPDLMVIRNAGASTLTVYANPNTNAATSAVDTVNGTTSVSILQNKSALCFAAKNGAYSCILSS